MKNDKPLTRREIKKAARLFALISMIHIDCTGSQDKDEFEMIEEVMNVAVKSFQKEFPGLVGRVPTTQAECVAAIKGMTR